MSHQHHQIVSVLSRLLLLIDLILKHVQNIGTVGLKIKLQAIFKVGDATIPIYYTLVFSLF